MIKRKGDQVGAICVMNAPQAYFMPLNRQSGAWQPWEVIQASRSYPFGHLAVTSPFDIFVTGIYVSGLWKVVYTWDYDHEAFVVSGNETNREIAFLWRPSTVVPLKYLPYCHDEL